MTGCVPLDTRIRYDIMSGDGACAHDVWENTPPIMSALHISLCLFLSLQDLFLICFSVVDPTSYQNIELKWVPELKRHAAGVPFIVVGTKLDLRNDPKTIRVLAQRRQQPITYNEAQRRAGELGALYVECSALTQDGLKEVVL